jgi:hypothetical protein
MKRRSKGPRSTVPAAKPARRVAVSLPARRARVPPPARSRPMIAPPPPRTVAHIMDDSEKSLVDVLDSLLNQGVVLNAELILALANVDLVYLRLSALLCAADRVLPPRR